MTTFLTWLTAGVIFSMALVLSWHFGQLVVGP